MEFAKLRLEDCFAITSTNKRDKRGTFVKTFNKTIFSHAGIDAKFSESFYSISCKNSLRGMHYQRSPHQVAKLISCAEGEILDVFLDIRKNSKTYGKFDYCILSQENAKMVYLPEGIAHGFLTLSERSIVCYQQSGGYVAESDDGILWNSFGMNWNITDPIISDRDSGFKEFVL